MKFFFVFGKSLPLFPEWLRARSFFQCRAQAQSFLPCPELSAVHRAFCRAQSFFQCTELFPVHRAFSSAQSFFLCAELFPVRRAFSCAQSFFLCAELFPVHRAFSSAVHRHRAFCRAQSFVLAAFATLVCQRNCVFLCKGTKLKIVMPVFCKGTKLKIVMPVFCGTELRFGSLCNLGLSKKLRFFFAKAQNSRIRRSRILGIVCRFFACTELFPVPCTGTELFPVHRAFSSAVHRHRAFCRAQSFFQCTELFPVHRAFS